MAKKKKNENLPEGMSRRQAKLAARAAERAALEKDPRPFGGLVAEADLIALQEFVPAAEATVDVKGATRPIKIVTVLPGAVAAVAREDEALVALQTQSHSQNPGRDLAYALNWAKDAAAGESLASAAADGTQPALTELIDASAPLIVTARDEFTWWVGEGETVSPMYAQAIREANERIIRPTLSRRISRAWHGGSTLVTARRTSVGSAPTITRTSFSTPSRASRHAVN